MSDKCKYCILKIHLEGMDVLIRGHALAESGATGWNPRRVYFTELVSSHERVLINYRADFWNDGLKRENALTTSHGVRRT
jgi:hypothetical protein